MVLGRWEGLVGGGGRQPAALTGSCKNWAMGERKITEIREEKRPRVVEFFVHELVD